MSTRRKPGPKSPHSGMWQKGQSGNPSGRPPRSERERTFEQACREAVVDLLPGMVEAVQDETVPVKERASVFGMLAEHGFGKAVDRIAVQTLSGVGSKPRQLTTADLLNLSEPEIRAIGEREVGMEVDMGEVVSEQ